MDLIQTSSPYSISNNSFLNDCEYTMISYASNNLRAVCTSIADRAMQREFMWLELTTTYKGMLTKLRAAKSIREYTMISYASNNLRAVCTRLISDIKSIIDYTYKIWKLRSLIFTILFI